MQRRTASCNYLQLACCLLQEFLVDCAATVEDQRLGWVNKSLATLRSSLYRGFVVHLLLRALFSSPVSPTVRAVHTIPSSAFPIFTGPAVLCTGRPAQGRHRCLCH